MSAIDHIVFNTRDRTDAAAEFFARAGFIVTPRGYHTLGSINHTIVFGSDYLELLGYPPGQPPAQRPELEARPAELMATVLATADADATHAGLVERGMHPRPVQTFSRPVDLGAGRSGDARFRVTRLEPGAVPGTWVYFCQHLTRDLVWRPEWQAHPNGASGVVGIEIEVPDLAAALPAYRACLEVHAVETLGGSGSQAVFRLPGCTLHLHQRTGPARMRALRIGVVSLEVAQAALRKGQIAYTIGQRPAPGEVHPHISIDCADSLGATIQLCALAQ